MKSNRGAICSNQKITTSFRDAKIGSAMVALGLCLTSRPALATADWVLVDARVTVVEGSYAPDQIPFQININGGTCGAGSFLTWQASGSDTASKIANYQAMLSVLTTALVAQRPIQVYGRNAGCAIENIWLK